ncbi:unnamed protein product [Musa hybrid cultivar]
MIEDGVLSFTVDEALLSIEFGKFQTFVLCYAGMGWISEAMEMMLLSFVGPAVQLEWELSSQQESLITSVVFVGMLLGAYSWGIVSDIYGRRMGFLFTALITSVAGFLSSFAPNYWSLIFLRFMVGIGLGGGPVLASWFLEFIPSPHRGKWMVIFSAFWTIGTIFEASLAWAIMPRFGWRWLLASSSLPSFLLLLFYAATPESPRYLCMRGRITDAMQILEQMARANHKALPSGILVSESQLELDEKSDHSEAAHLVGNGWIKSSDEDMNMKASCVSTLRRLLSPKLIRSTLLLWMVFFGNAFSYYGIVLLTSELSNGKRACTVKSSQPSQSNDDSLYKDVFVTSFAEVPGLIISAAIVDRIGRKLSMSSMLFISCVFLIPLVFPRTGEVTTGLLFCARISISASFTIIYIYAPEIYPTSVRASGIGIASSVGRIGGITCPLVAVGLVHGCHQSAAVLLFELVIFLSGIAVCLFPLETSGRDLTDSPLEPSIIDAEQKPVSTENLNEQPPSAEVEKNVSPDSSAIDHSRDALGQLVSPNAVGDLSASFPAYIMYNPQTQMHYYGGYENPTGEFEEYTHHFNTEGMEVGSAVAYSENHPLAYYTKHGCSPHIPYGPCYPVTMPLYSNGGDVLYYAPHHFSFSGIQCQQTAHPSMPHLSSSAPTSQIDFTAPVDQEGALLADTANSKSTCFGPRPGYHLSYGSYGRDWRIFPDGTFSVSPLPSSAVSIRLGRQIPSYGFGSLVNSYNRWYHNSGLHHDSTFGVSYPRVGSNGRSLIAAGKITKQERGNAPFGRSNGTLEFLSEQNRGPRADGSKNRANQQLSVNESDGVSCSRGVDRKLYNTLDFGTDYKDARFFIIKSYSEDNVHKSIKYGVWASTSNGNRKLNSAYVEMREQEHSYPIFLFFSVNASGHFCGVAEMIGPVDFEKSVDYWNKDKWTGQCPVKWHIVKDVPNTMFRHIILEKNDNKPVTNSRDTQEVKLEQGLEMLGIFNKHEYEESILDDFEFYEERETALRQRKACEHPTPTNSISQISNSFAQAVRF